MAGLAPPATMKTPVRAGLRARPGPASQELFSRERRSTCHDGLLVVRLGWRFPAGTIGRMKLTQATPRQSQAGHTLPRPSSIS